MSKNQKNNSLIIRIGVIGIVFGIILISNNYLNSKVDKAYNAMNLQVLALSNKEVVEIVENNKEEFEIIVEEKPTQSENNVVEKPQQSQNKINYIGKLQIPKISLERGFTSIDSKYNSISYGIETIKGSTYPDTPNGNLILLSHSGSSYISQFSNLYKLVIGDKCYIEYLGKTYTFTITNIYTKPKIGKITIDRDYNKTTLTLITCTKNSKTLQTVYIAELN